MELNSFSEVSGSIRGVAKIKRGKATKGKERYKH